MRNLIIVKIRHTKSDMTEEVAEVLRKQLGEVAYNKMMNDTELYWDEIEEELNNLTMNEFLKISDFRIYQDGLPVSGGGQFIIDNVAEQGSRNYKLIKDMQKLGAKVEESENPELLIEERNYIQKVIKARNTYEQNIASSEYKKNQDRLIIARDKFIADRIDKTLKEKEYGIVFIGKAHNIEPYLKEDIKARYLI